MKRLESDLGDLLFDQMKTALVFSFLTWCTFLSAQSTPGLVSKKIDTIHSKVLNEDRYVWIHAPDKPTKVPAPVIYVLDGQVLFDEVNKSLTRLSKETGRDIANEVIAVGVDNIGERYRDYSPTLIVSSPWVDSYTASISGGGEKFASFWRMNSFLTSSQNGRLRLLGFLSAIQWGDWKQ